MKIGVLTFHRCINYGSYWQARCLLDALRAGGHDAVLLDHRSRRSDIAEWRCALRPVLPTPVPAADRPLYEEKTRKFFRAFQSLASSPPFPLDDPRDLESFDLVIVGSDEVWNLQHPWYAGCGLFFGEGIQSKRLIAYAASFGNYRAADGLPRVWADRLRKFELISVRDENSRCIIAEALGIEPQIALDPCLQFLPGRIKAYGEPFRSSEPYVVVYGHNFSAWFSTYVQGWARQRQRRLVSIGYRNDWAHQQWLTAGPEDFARCIAGAQAVVTNFFHGSIFALCHEKPFLCEKTSYRSIKLCDLLAHVGGEEHLARHDRPVDAYDARLSEPLPGTILRKIEERRKESQAWLDRALRPGHAH